MGGSPPPNEARTVAALEKATRLNPANSESAMMIMLPRVNSRPNPVLVVNFIEVSSRWACVKNPPMHTSYRSD
jgi:hypothetical protein